MLQAETKRKIDNARDILVGKIPVPMSQIEQITIALIYKFMGDIDEQNKELGGESFFYGDFEKYSWKNLMDRRIGAQERLNLYAEGLEMMTKNGAIPELFRNIFRNAYLPFRDPQVLDRFLKQINEFSYDHSEELGNAFEYLLSTAGSQGDAGQFRTPRHIIDFIVSVVNPTKDDTILDPACGTAGFLISAYKWILEQNKDKKAGDKLSILEKEKLHKNFVGYDISHEMVRLSLVNVYLHNFADPKIYEYDTLSDDRRWNEEYSCILANPPFMTPKGGIKAHDKFSIRAKKSEVLFVDYIMEHLTINGKAGIIVPEGIIFQSANAYKELRKKMIEQKFLYAVISLPSGVFQPYSGVKTSILLFDKKVAKKTDKVLFVKIENDGFDLGAQRRPIDGSDLLKAREIVLNYKKAILNGENFDIEKLDNEWKKKVLIIEKSKIAESGDYNLSMERYRVNEELGMMNGKWEMVELGEVATFSQGIQVDKDKQEKILKEGYVRFWRIIDFTQGIKGDERYIKYPGEKYMIKEDDVVMVRYGATAGFVGIGKKGALANNLFKINFDKKILNNKFLYYFLKDKNTQQKIFNMAGGGAMQALSFNIMKKLKIPLPPLEIQKQIVEELDNYQKIIDGAKQVVGNYKPYIDIDSSWEMVELGEVFDNITEQIKPNEIQEEQINYIGLENIEKNTGKLVGNIKTDPKKIKSNKLLFREKDILYGKLRPNLNKVYYSEIKGVCSTDILVLRGSNKVIPKFYLYYFLGKKFNKEVLKGLGGAQLPRTSYNYIKQIKIPLPALEVQKQIVEKIEEEQKLVEANKKLIEMFEKKIQERVRRVWEG